MVRTIYEKKQKLREKAIRLDLVPDKGYSLSGRMGGNMIRYVSIGKFKRQFAPLFSECGLDFKMNTVQIEELPNEKTRGTFEFVLTDTETGEQDVTRIVADGSSATDKGIVIASSYAMRMWFSNSFCLEDGIDFERNEGDTASALLSEKAIPSVDEAQPTLEAKERPVKVSEPEPSDKKTAEPVSIVKTGEGVSKVEGEAAKRAMEKIEILYKNGAIVEDEYKKAVGIYGSLSGSADVLALVGIKRTGEKNDKTKKQTEGM